ncbi:MAG: hypothetical protein VYC47_02725 [Verrucomicrobiota bacterium]|nr:hypothetical protein [Verrucomicrobiota bacterium]
MIGNKLDLQKIKPLPLAKRKSLSTLEEVLVPLDAKPAAISDELMCRVEECAGRIREAKANSRAVMLIYGAHLIKNGAALILDRLIAGGWLTHLATNGAGTIHDWEYAWLGRSTECVRSNVATGTFGTWEETGRNIHLALLAGGVEGLGFGEALGRLIDGDGVDLPPAGELANLIAAEPSHELTAARAELLHAMRTVSVPERRCELEHRWKEASVVGSAFRHGVPLTVHPGIGYDIISNHPMFNGAAIGRAAQVDFQTFAGTLEQLDGGVVLSVGSAIMGPQVFEKALSCVNHIRLQEGREIVRDHSMHIVDLQDGGNWDWTQGEPPITSPAYYLRFCKTYARMGGEMHYLQCDNLAFVQHLHRALGGSDES